jgi:hypothetical protein
MSAAATGNNAASIPEIAFTSKFIADLLHREPTSVRAATVVKATGAGALVVLTSAVCCAAGAGATGTAAC